MRRNVCIPYSRCHQIYRARSDGHLITGLLISEQHEQLGSRNSEYVHSFTMHLDIITSLFVQLNAQVDCSRKILKLTLRFILKCSYMFRFNKPSSGSLLLCLAEVTIIKIVKNVVMNHFGLVAAYLSSRYWYVQCV